MDTSICGKTIKRGKQRWRINEDGTYQVLMFGSHGPNNPSGGLSWQWNYISSDRVPEDVKRFA